MFMLEWVCKNKNKKLDEFEPEAKKVKSASGSLSW
jgi:hypothetical protein